MYNLRVAFVACQKMKKTGMDISLQARGEAGGGGGGGGRGGAGEGVLQREALCATDGQSAAVFVGAVLWTVLQHSTHEPSEVAQAAKGEVLHELHFVAVVRLYCLVRPEAVQAQVEPIASVTRRARHAAVKNVRPTHVAQAEVRQGIVRPVPIHALAREQNFLLHHPSQHGFQHGQPAHQAVRLLKRARVSAALLGCDPVRRNSKVSYGVKKHARLLGRCVPLQLLKRIQHAVIYHGLDTVHAVDVLVAVLCHDTQTEREGGVHNNVGSDGE
mmetsp:Transcript_37882/g.95211  ORF Transcript_37882/g.95211 Transcript_37882/m.95211 type:complete len:272 (+) Transcript_37882:113-928(+)